MLVWVSKLTTFSGRPSRPPAAFISSTAKASTSYIGLPAASSPPERSYMLAIPIGSAAVADWATAGANTLAAALGTKFLRVIFMVCHPMLFGHEEQDTCHGRAGGSAVVAFSDAWGTRRRELAE